MSYHHNPNIQAASVSLACWLDAIIEIRNVRIRSHSVGANIVAVAVDSLITPEILKPARYLGNELGAVHKPWESGTVRWALTYPEIYEAGASNLGYIILYS